MSDLATLSARHRPELVGIAYRLLGSVTEAEDAAQEALLRLATREAEDLDRPGAWLATVVARICLDRLRSAARRREVYVGPWLPEPLVSAPDAAADVEAAEDLSMAFLVVLESLSPAERVALLLHDVFGYGYDDLAATLDRGEPACRQLVSRARKAVQARRPRYERDARRRDDVVAAFIAACAGGDMGEVVALLDPDVVLVADGGGLAAAARRPIEGRERVAQFIGGLLRLRPPGWSLEHARVNGTLGLVVHDEQGVLQGVYACDVADGLITSFHGMRNPEKLANVTPLPHGHERHGGRHSPSIWRR